MNNERGVVFSEKFRCFLSEIEKNSSSPAQIAETIKKNFHLIENELPASKICIKTESLESVIKSKVNNNLAVDITVCSDSEVTNSSAFSFTHQINENEKTSLLIYPRKDFSWNESDEPTLEAFAEIMLAFFGRARFSGIIDNIFSIDFLTGTANIKGLSAFGEKLSKKGILSSYCGLFINIKNFNYINRTAGAKAGDEVLKSYAKILSEKLASDKEIVGRIGGDNFLILVKKENLNAILESIKCVEVKFSADRMERVFEVRPRIGIYNVKDNDLISTVIHSSNIAYQQTRVPGNGDCAWFNEMMVDRMMKDKEISMMFMKAIEDHEFVVYYQPKVTLSNNHLCGCEALVRWFRNGKIVPPMEFIPTLEREGSICTLDFYVLEQVCRDIRTWIDKGMKPFCVSVNFSKNHLRDADFAERIVDIIKKYDIESKYIEVELTESSSYEHYDDLRKFIHCMKENGIITSIDDFGTGYSSLNLLKNIDVDVIKLDKSFLDNLEKGNDADKIVIKHIIGLVSDLNMDIIAEGVETSGQADFLRSVNCDMAQGYLFDKPLPCVEFEKRLLNDVYYM